MHMIFPGLKREREISAMVSTLTHVVSSEVPTGAADDYAFLPTKDMPYYGSSSSTFSNYVVGSGSSSIKRTREQDDLSFVDHFGSSSHGGASSTSTTTIHT
ncbi:hypothetical protein PIB30_102499, partial [Stylosanthes scabra]|nr:hypothetical protein [Stylosanthes scabra]